MMLVTQIYHTDYEYYGYSWEQQHKKGKNRVDGEDLAAYQVEKAGGHLSRH
jgi:hypothetical protein